MSGRVVIVGVMVGLVAGCAPKESVRPGATTTRVAATKPAARGVERGVYEGNGLRVGWPSGWERVGSEDYVVMLKGQGGSQISLDVPALPAHVPGLIPLGMVVNGYRDDLRKQVGQMEERELPSPGVPPESKVRMVRSAWQGGAMQETAAVMVHDDHVYILRGRSDAQHERATRDAMDEMLGSWRWVAEKK